ncbi:MAG: hypothetical protein I3274_00535 [Candidatus Moeniiplasma glomeromycotorum]|nr:hypothetical protein [Candidatus Moeniiplasma glomeromycotorum]
MFHKSLIQRGNYSEKDFDPAVFLSLFVFFLIPLVLFSAGQFQLGRTGFGYFWLPVPQF